MNDEFETHEERMSDVDGYTIVRGEHPVVHLLRAYPECEAEGGERIEVSREDVLAALGDDAWSASSCPICFPRPGFLVPPVEETDDELDEQE